MMSRALNLLGTQRRKSDSRKCRCTSTPHRILVAGAVLQGKRLHYSLQRIARIWGSKGVSKDKPKFFHHSTVVSSSFSARATGSSIAGLTIAVFHLSHHRFILRILHQNSNANKLLLGTSQHCSTISPCAHHRQSQTLFLLFTTHHLFRFPTTATMPRASDVSMNAAIAQASR